MVSRLFALALASLAISSATAFAEPTIDLVAKSIRLRTTIGDDVNPQPVQLVEIALANQGNLPWHNRQIQMGLRLNARVVTASIYGPVSSYFQLGAAIPAGSEGRVYIYLPPGTFRHCDSIRLAIDTGRVQQVGYSSVFANDVKTLIAVDPSSIRPCVLPPLPRP